MIVNVSDPQFPDLVGSYDTGNQKSVVIKNDYAYVAGGSGLLIINISNPDLPRLERSVPGNAEDVAIKDNYAYVADSESGILIVDITNPGSPQIVATYSNSGQAFSLDVENNYAYIASDSGLFSLNISDPKSPGLVESYKTIYAGDIAVKNKYAYVDNRFEILILDVNNPSSPQIIANYTMNGYTYDIVPENNYIYVANSWDGFLIFNVSNAKDPRLEGNYDSGNVYGIATGNNNYAYIAAGSGLFVMDIIYPKSPQLIGNYDDGGDYTREIAVEDGFAYIADYFDGLYIIDISNPISPSLKGRYECSSWTVATIEDHVYLSDTNNLLILNVSDPISPKLVGIHKTTSNVKDVTIEGDYAYVANGDNGLLILNVSDPSSPYIAEIYDTAGYAWNVAVSGNDVYIDDGNNGLVILHTDVLPESNSLPTGTISSISPNPATEGELISFNGSGTDSDGNIVGYNWTSSIDGHLNSSSSFSTSDLSLGTHTISFSVQDNDGAWSDPVSETLETIGNQVPEVNISATPIENVSIHNPVTIRLNSTDNHPAITEFVIQDSEGQNVINLTVTDDVANDATWEYVWNTTFSNGTKVPSGTCWLFVNSSDTSDNTASANVSVVVDNTKPTASITEITGSNTVGEIVHANSILQVNATADGTPGNVSSLFFTLDSEFTSFHRVVEASFINGEWTAEFDLTTIPDDGKYMVTATVTDAALNINSTTAPKTVLLDRKAPSLYPVSSVYNETHGIVNISSSECLNDIPVVYVNTDEVMLSENASKWSGFFNLEGLDFNINVTGIDVAGNVGVDNSTMHIERVETVNNTANFTSNKSGTTIDFRTNNDTKSDITVTESDKPLANVTNGSVGLHFIDVNLGNELQTNLTNATIRIPVNMNLLPEGVAVEDVTIRYYNETSDEWEPFSTSVETIGDIEYWVATVDHFSTYAAMADDKTPPILDDVTPEDGTKFDENTTSVNIRFNYSDAASDIDVSSIIFKFNGNEIIASDDLEITGNYAAYNATGLDTGDYTSEVTVADDAGNNVIFATTFSIASGEGTGTKPGNNGGSSSSGGGGGGGNTGEAFENILTKAAQTCKIAPGETARYEFGEEKCNISYIQFTGVTNAGQISTLIEVLKDTSALVDEDAPGEVYQNLNIWVGNAAFGDDKVEDSVIGFRVDKEWLSDNGFEVSEVALFHYSDGKWNKLPTTQTDEDDDFIYFEAETPGFSPFAISAIPQEGKTSVDATSGLNESLEEKKREETGNKTKSNSNETPGFGVLLTAGVLMITILLIRRKD
jgi:PGF-pre-PGF domain-containing protein